MSGQLCWLSANHGDGEKILYLRLQPHHPWKAYTSFPMIAVPDYKILRGSKGWATCQHLMKAGWTLIPSHQEFQTQIPYWKQFDAS